MKEILEKKGIKVIDERQNGYKCEYNKNKIILELNSGFGYNYRLNINNKTILTRGSLMTCIAKILNYK